MDWQDLDGLVGFEYRPISLALTEKSTARYSFPNIQESVPFEVIQESFSDG